MRIKRILGVLGVLLWGVNGLWSQSVVPDTSRKDSVPKKVPDARVRVYDPEALELLLPFRPDFQVPFHQVPVVDEVESLDSGYVQTLGQYGKAYQAFRFGTLAHPLGTKKFINPLTGAEEAYLISPENGTPFLDTRTPFVNLWYGQGKQELTQMRAMVSQNLSPFVNATITFRRRRFEGPYLYQFTDHYNAMASVRVRSRNDRFHLFSSGYFSQLQDELNGGVFQDQPFDQQFGKRTENVNLENVFWGRFQRGFWLKPMFLLVKDSSSSPHRAVLFSTFIQDAFIQEFRDSVTSAWHIQDTTVNLIPTYPTLGPSFNKFFERTTVTRTLAGVGFGYRFSKPFLSSGHSFEYQQEFREYAKDFSDRKMNLQQVSVRGDLRFDPGPFLLQGNYEARNRSSNLFAAENFLKVEAGLGLPKALKDFEIKRPGPDWAPKDSFFEPSFRRPLNFFGNFWVVERNPSFLQTYYRPYYTNSLETDSNFVNSVTSGLRIGFRYEGPGKLASRHQNVVKGSFAELSLFRTGTARMIWYGPGMDLIQASAGGNASFQGIEIRGRYRLGRFVAEGNGVLQKGTAKDSLLTAYWVPSQPAWYGHAGIYYENLDLSIAAMLRMGVECHFQGAFFGMAFDPASQQFYGQNVQENPMNARIDAIFSTRVKKADIYLRVVNAAEGLWSKGYYSTPFYPMLDRTFMLGFQWSFFD